jgi:5'-nucleotidase
MLDPIGDLSSARILVTNDDGIQANGIAALEEIARGLSDDVWVVAPEQEQSGAAHSLTLRHPLRIREVGPRHYAVDGTPTDSVLMAVGHILRDRRPDLLLSGINRGANLGEDVTYSGTVAAAMEGVLLGVRSIALSLSVGAASKARWHTPKRLAPELIRCLAAAKLDANILININFPDAEPDDVKPAKVVRLGRRKLGEQLEERHDPRGTPYYWIGPMREEAAEEPDTDLAAVYGNAVAVTPVHLDLTHHPAIHSIRQALE